MNYKGKPKSKTDLRIHALRRAFERYDIILNFKDLKDIEECIRGESKVYIDTMCIHKESNTRSHYLVRYYDKFFIVVYNKNVKAVCTFLPFDPELKIEKTDSGYNYANNDRVKTKGDTI